MRPCLFLVILYHMIRSNANSRTKTITVQKVSRNFRETHAIFFTLKKISTALIKHSALSRQLVITGYYFVFIKLPFCLTNPKAASVFVVQSFDTSMWCRSNKLRQSTLFNLQKSALKFLFPLLLVSSCTVSTSVHLTNSSSRLRTWAKKTILTFWQ